MDPTALVAILAFGVMFALFVIVPTLVKRKHADADVEME
jgi:hypothetical protein